MPPARLCSVLLGTAFCGQIVLHYESADAKLLSETLDNECLNKGRCVLDSTIPPKLRSVIDRELDSGERVVWSGMPRAVCFTLASTGAFVFGIPWTAFALFWMGAAAAGTMNAEEDIGFMTFFPLFGLPFVLVGFGLLSAPLWAYRKGLNTAYVLYVTDRRCESQRQCGGKNHRLSPSTLFLDRFFIQGFLQVDRAVHRRLCFAPLTSRKLQNLIRDVPNERFSDSGWSVRMNRRQLFLRLLHILRNEPPWLRLSR